MKSHLSLPCAASLLLQCGGCMADQQTWHRVLGSRSRLVSRKMNEDANYSIPWIQEGDGAYDCTVPANDPCKNVMGNNLLPLPPDCKQFMLCDDNTLSMIGYCDVGTVFDNKQKQCVDENQLTDCPCKVNSASETEDVETVGIHNDNASGATSDGTAVSNSYMPAKEVSKEQPSAKTGKIPMPAIVKEKSSSSKSSKQFKNNSKTFKVEDSSSSSSSKSSKQMKGKSVKGEVSKDPPYIVAPVFDGGSSSHSTPAHSSTMISTKSSSAPSSLDAPQQQIETEGYITSMASNYQPVAGGPIVELDFIPQAYNASIEYKENDIVHHETNVYHCEPPSKEQRCGDIWGDGWILIGKHFFHEYSDEVALSDGSAEEASVELETLNFKSPTSAPTSVETESPSSAPTSVKTESPSSAPTSVKTESPSSAPTSVKTCMTGGDYEDFESANFPVSPWTTGGGDGNWTIDQGHTFEGEYSIKSPDLSGFASTLVVSNASITVCDDYIGGTLSLAVRPSVLPPTDTFRIYIDGEMVKEMADLNEWEEVTVDVPPRGHVIDLSYQYNPYNLNPIPSRPSNLEGVVYVDGVSLIEKAPTSSNFIIDIEQIFHGGDDTLDDKKKVRGDSSKGTAPTSTSTAPSAWLMIFLLSLVLCAMWRYNEAKKALLR